ncbi:MAG: Na+/H+ antiporter subunit D, partial [Ectothiorhodospiraceae bacterium]|nr:Na+/H+ antiporter subunit D [Ectothiorhodospiraceae bacterium]
KSLALMILPIAALAAMTVFIGLGAQPIYELADAAAEQLLDSTHYIQAVLGETP